MSRCGKSLHSDRPPGSTWTTRLLHSPGRVTVPSGKPPETTTRISDTNFNLSTGFQIQFTLSDLIGFLFFFGGSSAAISAAEAATGATVCGVVVCNEFSGPGFPTTKRDSKWSWTEAKQKKEEKKSCSSTSGKVTARMNKRRKHSGKTTGKNNRALSWMGMRADEKVMGENKSRRPDTCFDIPSLITRLTRWSLEKLKAVEAGNLKGRVCFVSVFFNKCKRFDRFTNSNF